MNNSSSFHLQVIPGITSSDHLVNLIEGYDLTLRCENRSPHTIRDYLRKLRYWIDYNKTNGLPLLASELEPKSLRHFILHLQNVEADANNPHKPAKERKLSTYTIKGYVRVIKTFMNWLVTEGYLKSDPFATVKVPRVTKKIIETFDESQIKRLLASIDIKTPLGIRDYTIILLLLDTGLRRNEVVSLKLQDVRLKEGWLKVIGKGDKERLVPIGLTVQKALWKYINGVRPKDTSQELFINTRGEPLGDSGISQIVRRLCTKAGIEGIRCSPHTFRHTAAIWYLRQGGDPFSLQRLLGHTDLATTRLYVNISNIDLQAAHRKASPVDNLELRRGNTKH